MEIQIGKLTYSLDDTLQIAHVIDCEGCNGNILIPYSINYEHLDYTVVNILKFAFRNSHSIKSIEFPNNSKLKSIDFSAFYSTQLESIELPSSMLELKEGWCNETKKTE